MDLLKMIGENIRSERTSQGLTLDQLAEKACLSGRMLGNIERARSNPSILVLCSICHALGISLDEVTDYKFCGPKSCSINNMQMTN